MTRFAERVLSAYPDIGRWETAKLSARGSTRRFIRVVEEGKRVVAVDASDCPNEHRPYVELAVFLHDCSVPIPEVYAQDPTRSVAVVEDLGDTTLLDLSRKGNSKNLRAMLSKTIEALIHARAAVAQRFDEFERVARPCFDRNTWRWETEYFRSEFLIGVCGIAPASLSGLDEEFERLALRCSEFPRGFVHRDFQSTNILIGPMGVSFVDFQGARPGPLGYDLASLCRDPYLELPKTTRIELFEAAKRVVGTYRTLAFEMEHLEENERTCALQRLMQALGAYGFLWRKKGREWFAQFIPSALRLLREVVGEDGYMTELSRVLGRSEVAVYANSND